MVVLAFADILTAFSPKAIGSKVITEHQAAFLERVKAAIVEHDPLKDRMDGQHFIGLTGCNSMVLNGVGLRTSDPNDYVARVHRGQVSLYLKRSPFWVDHIPVESVHVVVYTKKAYLNDPDGTTGEFARIETDYPGYTHVLVAVLASSGTPRLSPYRFVHNLAGGNREAMDWTADEIRAKAREILDYENSYITVAD